MYLIGGSIATGRICGALVCALCSVELGNEEGIFRYHFSLSIKFSNI
jgi:hypothetical protein